MDGLAIRGAMRRWLGGAGVALAVLLPIGAAAQEHCAANQAQLGQAIVDSRTTLDSATATLDSFAAALIAPRAGPIDAEPVVSARGRLDAFISALSDFGAQVTQIGQSCGPQFAADAQALSALIARFQSERARAGQLLADHQALAGSGEPAMTQAQMEGVQQALARQGFYQASIDGRFGAGTRAAIGAWQAAQGQQNTGYLTSNQLAMLLATPAEGAGGAGTGDQTAGLPPAPPVDGSGPGTEAGTDAAASPPGSGGATTALSDEASQICNQNITAVNDATEQTRSFREAMLPRLNQFRVALRGPRLPAFDGGEADRMASETSEFIDPMQAFHDQAEAVVGQCGDGFDSSYEALTAQLDSLRSLLQRIARAKEAYQELVASGEPAMSEETMRQVQTGLRNLGHYEGDIDALFGSGTRSAIEAYQDSIGAEETGYLSEDQIAALREAATRAPAPPVPSVPPADDEPPLPPAAADASASTDAPAATDAPESADTQAATGATPAASPEIVDVRRVLFAELSQRALPAPLSGLSAGDGRIGDMWWEARDHIAQGRAQQAVDGRLALLGAAYLDRGAESLAMVDSHLLIGEAFARLGVYGDAAFHLQRAYDIWTALGRDDAAEGAVLLERLATARLAQAVADGSVGGARFDDVLRLLERARTADASAPGVLDRMADLYVAAGRSPEDPAVSNAISARYGS